MTHNILLEENLSTALPDCRFIIENHDNKYRITAIGHAFAGLNSVARHKMIYQHIQQYIHNGMIHAVTIHALTPEEYTTHTDTHGTPPA